MPEYSSRDEGSWTVSTTMLGWGLLGLALVVVVFFLAGMYVGYNRGLQDGLARGDRPSPPEQFAEGRQASETGEEDIDTPVRERADTPSPSGGPIVITDREVEGEEATTDTRSTPTRTDGPTSSEREAAPVVTEGPSPGDDEPEEEADGGPGVVSGPFYTIQIASSQKRSNANRVRDRLRDRGHDASISEAAVNDERFFRVRVGQFPTREAASRYADAMVDEGEVDDYWISRVSP